VKKLIGCLIVLVGVAVMWLPPAQAQDAGGDILGGGLEWDMNLSFGQLFFREDFKWTLPGEEHLSHDEYDSYVMRLDFCAGNYDFRGLEYGLLLGLMTTEDQGLKVSFRDIMDIPGQPPLVSESEANISADGHCMDVIAEVGWGGNITEGLDWNALMGYAYRRLELESTLPYDRNYDVHWLNFKARLKWDVAEKCQIRVWSSVGPVLASKRTDDTWGTIRGTGGVMFEVVGVVAYMLSDNVIIDAGPFYCFQRLGGGDTHAETPGGTAEIEWDDSFAQIVGGTVGLIFLF